MVINDHSGLPLSSSVTLAIASLIGLHSASITLVIGTNQSSVPAWCLQNCFMSILSGQLPTCVSALSTGNRLRHSSVSLIKKNSFWILIGWRS